MGRTTVEIPEGLLLAAMKAIGARTRRAAILEGLRRIVAPSDLDRARRLKGRVSASITMEDHFADRHADAR